jgi:putative Holliday junction resolvase
LPQPRTVLAFDFGLRRIGVAIGQDITGSASPLGVVSNRDDGVDHTAISALIKEWRPTCLVVGMPTHADGSPSQIAEHVEAFIEELRRYELDIDIAGNRGRISKESIDSAAAVIIAERYLSSG